MASNSTFVHWAWRDLTEVWVVEVRGLPSATGDLEPRRCAVPECERVARNRGLCDMDYQRQRKHGDVGAAVSMLMPREGKCRVDGCTRAIKSRGLCSRHYDAARLEGQVCSVDGCERRIASSKQVLCTLHYERVKRHGDVGPVEPLIAARGEGNWYRRMPLEQGLVLEHRVVMEGILGRKLYPEEEVHHKNGRRWDNRPENLELWTRRHPVGVRVSDLLDYVMEHYQQELAGRLREAGAGEASLADVKGQRDDRNEGGVR